MQNQLAKYRLNFEPAVAATTFTVQEIRQLMLKNVCASVACRIAKVSALIPEILIPEVLFKVLISSSSDEKVHIFKKYQIFNFITCF